MPQLSNDTKADHITKGLMTLASEYAGQVDHDSRITARVLSKAAIDLPFDSKVRLYDILTKVAG